MFNRFLKKCLQTTLRSTYKTQDLRRVLPTSNLVTRSYHKTSIAFSIHFLHTENEFAYNILGSINLTGNIDVSDFLLKNTDIKDEISLQTYLEQNWRQKSPKELVTAFKTILEYCKLQSMNISNICFDGLTNGLLENIEKFSDEELLEVFDFLIFLPPCGSYASHNFHDIWSALDDICCMRLPQWNEEKYFSFGNKWYQLGLGKYSDFLYDVLERLIKRAQKLTKEQLVHAFFFMNVCRRHELDFEYEDAVNKKIDEMTLEEISVVAMGYFKTQSKIKVDNIALTMIKRLMEKEYVHEIVLSSILKVLRLSSRTSLANHLMDLLNHLENKLDKLPIIALIHVALLGTTLQIEHKPILKTIAQKIIENIDDKSAVRLKEIERILLTVTMFDFDPKTTPDFFTTVVKELENPLRRNEIIKHPRALSSALNFLSTKNIYSYQLMDEVLNDEYIDEVYGKRGKDVPRNLFCLDRSIDVECPDYTGNRMGSTKRYKAAKWLTDFSPLLSYKNKLNYSEKFFVEIYHALKKICGSKDLIMDEHVLPHFQRSDLLLCKDKKTGKFVEPVGSYNYILGDIMYPLDTEKLIWYAVVIAGWNNVSRFTGKPLGPVNMKIRQLKKIGYKPILVHWPKFGYLNEEQRINLLKTMLK